MTGKLVLENLKHQPMRSLLSILLIGVPVTLILTLVGLSHGMLDDAAERTRGIGADVIVRPKGSTLLSMRGGISSADGVLQWFASQPHVRMTTGVLNQPVQGVTLGATGINMQKYTELSGGFVYLKGGPLRQPNDVLIDDFYARQVHAGLNDTIQILNKPWHVAGIIASGKLARIVLPLDVLQDLTAQSNTVSQIYLKLDDPANTDQVVKALKANPKLEDWPIYSGEELASAYNSSNIPGLNAFIIVVMGIGVVIGFFVVCLSMYMAVLQRTREIGILKSLGSSKSFILRIILTEALILGVIGTIVGIVMSYGAYWLIITLVPASIPMKIVYVWWPIAGAIILAASIFGALYPGLSASRRDPIEALSYE